MSTCAIEGHPEMYSLGIRIAFYIHWFGEILVTHLGCLGLPIVRTSSLVLSMSISLALIIQCAKQALGPAEIYISLLLGSGMYFPLIPVYVIKFISCCHPKWDAECWMEKRAMAPWINLGLFIEAVIIGSFGLWFWTTLLHQRRAIGCPQIGFFFTSVAIVNVVFRFFHALLYAGFIIVCGGLGLDAVGSLSRNWRRARKKFRKREYVVLIYLPPLADRVEAKEDSSCGGRDCTYSPPQASHLLPLRLLNCRSSITTFQKSTA